jgi:23S rRNA (cytidine1920-2'-O)/16S rRNA (cytidine1409-2'-O)-methyltransferase
LRADQLLVQRGLAPSRSAAQRLIAHGAVRWRGAQGWAVPRKAGENLPEGSELEVTDDAELRFVSRGGLKLDAALQHCGIDVAGWRCLDAGQGTGGFTDVLLKRGASQVVGVDVGHGQLHSQLTADERVLCLEGVNARALGTMAFGPAAPARFELVVADLSFISLTLVLPALADRLTPGGALLALVKPQFELQPAQIGKGGIVREPGLFAQVEARLRGACAGLTLEVRDYFRSPVRGGDGNTEFFVWARPRHDPLTQGTT